MKSFKHINSDSLDAVVETLSQQEKAQIIAGGTDLLGTLKDRIHAEYPETLVNIKTVEGLSYIQEDGEGLKIGALTKLHDIETSEIIKQKFSILSEATHSVASPQIRKMGTIGGNICQETRCWYYRYPDNMFDCMRKGGNVCRALLGENHYHSIFGAAKVGDTPCTSNCPAETDIPAYLCKIREGDLMGAAKVLLEANPMPAITGRVCPHSCQDECNRAEFDDSVSIRDIERYMGDYILDHTEEIFPTPLEDTGKKIVIIGSGPAGLSAAFYLRTLGHSVTIFEKYEEAGGMLAYGIPEYRLPKDLVKKVVKTITDSGVEIKFNVEVGKDVQMQDLQKDYDSVLLASGAWKQPTIGLDGEELTVFGLDFLKRVNSGGREVPGKKVIVIGGGDVAADVAICSRRLGADEVIMACLESREEMPALEWEIEQALEENIELLPSWGPLRVLETDGVITGIELVRCTSVFDEEGRFAPEFDNSVTKTLEAEKIILAVGQRVDISFAGSELQVEHGIVRADPENQGTNMAGVYVSGDATGPASVIDAIVSARRAALGIHEYLQGVAAEKSNGSEDRKVETLLEFNNEFLKETKAVMMPVRQIAERKIDVEDALGLSKNDVETEVNRCLNCGCVAASPSDIAPVLIALGAKIKTTKQTVEAEDFFSTELQKSTVLDHNEVVVEIQLPGLNPDTELVYNKFRIRKSIDFPIVSVASVIGMKANKVDDARIVLGAVAPTPLRIRKVENFLKGKEINEETAEKAAAIAVQESTSLSRNEYKVQVARTLVKRAIMGSTG
jgi:NADPH-dependent glutamate synthase beta subunit-like oxidoreductase